MSNETFRDHLNNWESRPDCVRLETLKVGDTFTAYDGKSYRVSGWYKNRLGGCPLVVCLADGSKSMFAGRASGIPESA